MQHVQSRGTRYSGGFGWNLRGPAKVAKQLPGSRGKANRMPKAAIRANTGKVKQWAPLHPKARSEGRVGFSAGRLKLLHELIPQEFPIKCVIGSPIAALERSET